jgi:hypothetical protein
MLFACEALELSIGFANTVLGRKTRFASEQLCSLRCFFEPYVRLRDISLENMI